jgi:hypothetical protein
MDEPLYRLDIGVKGGGPILTVWNTRDACDKMIKAFEDQGPASEHMTCIFEGIVNTADRAAVRTSIQFQEIAFVTMVLEN